MRTLRRRAVALVGAIVLLTALASPALANAFENGTHYCQYNWTPYANGLSSGNTFITPPGSGTAQYFYNGGTLTSRRAYSPGDDGGFWEVATDGILSAPGTYAGCIPAS